MTSRITAAMVAQDAGVSIATVSLVVNGKWAGRVSASRAERVNSSVHKLGYTVDLSASQLSTGSSRTILLIAPDLANPYFASVITGVQEVIGGRFELLVHVSEGGLPPRPEAVANLLGLRTAGVIVGAPSPDFLAHWRSSTPTVLADAAGDLGDIAIPSVNFDLERSEQDLMRHFLERGHSRIAYLESETPSATFRRRRQALGQAAAELGLEIVRPFASSSTVSMESAAAAFLDTWPRWQSNRVTALVCATDIQAYGVLLAANSLSLRIPEDLAVAGHDDLPYSRVTSPALTTISLPGGALGRLAAQRLISEIDRDDGAMDGRGQQQNIESALIVRAST